MRQSSRDSLFHKTADGTAVLLEHEHAPHITGAIGGRRRALHFVLLANIGGPTDRPMGTVTIASHRRDQQAAGVNPIGEVL